MSAFRHGRSRKAVFGVEGNFDDCQNAVKAAFADPGFNTELRGRHRTELSSANSINWGRLLPQIVYYVSAYADMAAAGALAPGSPLDVCVPTGNFGNDFVPVRPQPLDNGHVDAFVGEQPHATDLETG